MLLLLLLLLSFHSIFNTSTNCCVLYWVYMYKHE